MRSLALVDAGPPPPPPFKTFDALAAAVAPPPCSSISYSPSLLIIAAILGFVVVASLAIHLLLRFLSARSSHLHSFVHPRSSTSSSASGSPSSALPLSTSLPSDRDGEKEGEKDREALISALPVFTLASVVATAPKSPGDCAVCLSRFGPDDSLRLLPACRHAFHTHCVDVWLRSTPSCPLCRSSIDTPTPTPPPPPPAATPAPEERRSGSFRVEIGSVSRRRSADAPPLPHGRSYSLGSSFEYLVEDEVEAVVARALQRPSAAKDRKHGPDGGDRAGPPPPGAQVAEAVGERGGSWLRDYVDRLASSASSSFSSLRFSSRRYDGGASDRGVGDGWDVEGNHHRTAASSAGSEDGPYFAFYRWLLGVSS